MKPPRSFSGPLSRERGDNERRDEAAAWVVRHDRGLSSAEQAAFAAWLHADPRNEVAWRRSAAVWGRFEGAAPLAFPPPAAGHRRTAGWLAAGMAAAAVLAFTVFVARTPSSSEPAAPAAVAAVAPETRVLADETLARLNTGAILVEAYTETERRVRLVQGEAYFAVTSDPARPFVVEAAGVRIQAVGTAFGVTMQSGLVDVLVTEGTVKVEVDREQGADAGDDTGDPAPLVTAGHRAVVSRERTASVPPVVVTEVDVVEVNRANDWRGNLLRLGGATLSELAAEFERQTGRRLVLADAALQTMRVGGRFPGGDIDGFVRVLEEHYGVNVRREADGTLVLERSR